VKTSRLVIEVCRCFPRELPLLSTMQTEPGYSSGDEHGHRSRVVNTASLPSLRMGYIYRQDTWTFLSNRDGLFLDASLADAVSPFHNLALYRLSRFLATAFLLISQCCFSTLL
jgi:hypothetical protein